MKYSLIFFIGAIISSCQSKEEKPMEPIHPRIKLVLESLHDPTGKLDMLEYNPDISEDSFISELQFNSKGQLIRESKFDSNANLKSKTTFKYDNHGNTIRLDVYAANGWLLTTTTSRFDADNKLIERNEVSSNDQIISKQRLEHKKDVNRWIVTYKKIKGRLAKTQECAFDKNGFNILNNYYTHETLKKKEIHTYDSNGNLMETVNLLSTGTLHSAESAFIKNSGTESYLDDGTVKTTEEHEYDADGNRITTIQYFPLTNKRITTRYKYGKSKMEAVTLLSNKMISSKKIVRYDDKQNVKETFRYGLGGRLEEHQRHLYEYDQAGNWTKHKTIINNKSISVVVRQIEYY